MASDNEASCESDPNFAVICSFMEKFSALCGLNELGFLELQGMLENTEEVPQELIDLHIKLLRKSRKSVSNERWEKAVVKFCTNLCRQDAYEIERFGYKNARLSSKLRVLKELLEMQFDYNAKIKNEINKMSAEQLRTQPLGRDKLGHAYWFQRDKGFEIRVYKEDPDEETWTLVAKDRDGLTALITDLNDGDSKISSESEKILEEDSNSFAEKPITDTGQIESSSDSNNMKKIDESDDSNTNSEELTDENHISDLKRERDNEDNSEDVGDAKRRRIEEVGMPIEEPLMLVVGKGSGAENNCPNPIVGEEIEESVMYFYGEGSGVECGTGNDSSGEKSSSLSDKRTNSEKTNTNSINDDNKSSVPTSQQTQSQPPKCAYKLGTIIDTKTDNNFFNTSIKSPTRKSRWDVETKTSDSSECGKVKEMVNKWEQIKDTPKTSLFFFGPGCLSFNTFGQKVPPSATDKSRNNIEHNSSKEIPQELEPLRVEKEPNEDGKVISKEPTTGTNLLFKEHEFKRPLSKFPREKKVGVQEETSAVDQIKVSEKNPSKGENLDISETDLKHPEEECNSKESVIIPKKQEEVVSKEPEVMPLSDETLDIREPVLKSVERSDIHTAPNLLEVNVDITEPESNSTKEEDAVGTTESELQLPESSERPLVEEVLDVAKPDLDHPENLEPKEPALKCLENEIVHIEEPELKPNKENPETEASEIKFFIEENSESVVPSIKDDSINETPQVKPETIEEAVIEEPEVDHLQEIEETESKTSEEVKEPLTEQSGVEPREDEKLPVQKLESVNPLVKASSHKNEPGLVGPEENVGLKTKQPENLKLKDGQVDDSVVETLDLKTPEVVALEEANVEVELQIPVAIQEPEVKPLKKEDTFHIEEVDSKPLEEKSKPPNDESSNEKPLQQPNLLENAEYRKEPNSEPSSEITVTIKEPDVEVKEKEQDNSDETNSIEIEETTPKIIEVSDERKNNATKLERNEDQHTIIQEVEPVIEEICIKKNAYICGDETSKNSEDIEVKKANNNLQNNLDENEENKQEKTNKKNKKMEVVNLRRGRSRGLQATATTTSIKNEEEEKAKVSNDEGIEKSDVIANSIMIESSDGSEVCELPDRDPLANSGEEAEPSPPPPTIAPTTLSTFSLDFNEESTQPPTTILQTNRKRSHESSPTNQETSPIKQIKMRGKKRKVNVKLRKSVEEQRQELVSSDDEKEKQEKKADENKDETVKKNNTKKKNRILQGLGIDPDIQPFLIEEPVIGVRQSRRIAQLKIKEEAERRKLEEEMLKEAKEKKDKKNKDKDYKYKRKIKSSDIEDADDDAVAEDDQLEQDKKKKKKKKKDDPRKLFDESNPWKTSSDDDDEVEEEEEELELVSDEDEALQFKSDHEFSPESDLENESEFQPLKRARTVKKESDIEEEVDDCPCQKCGKSDHPEWILLCDKCDNGWHCSCLRPPLLIIPEGDWYCPPCQHVTLIQNLQEKLKDYDKTLKRRELDLRRKERLAYVGISLNNVLPSKEEHHKKKKRRKTIEEDDFVADDDEVDNDNDKGHEDYQQNEESGSSDEEEEEQTSGEQEESVEEESDSDEPIYQLRERRQAHSYRFNDYDELINSAIQEDMEKNHSGGYGTGKDIATIVKAELEKGTVQVAPLNLSASEPEPLPAVVPAELPPILPPQPEDIPELEYEEDIRPPVKKLISRKKSRKLNSLDVISEDEDSDEDFKGTSSESEDEFDADDLESEYSSDFDTRRGGKRRKDSVRRSTRARTSRYDADFIDDGETEEEEPKKKKKKSIWDESESEESDRSWGRRKRKPKQRNFSVAPKKQRSKKKKKNEDSDVELFNKKKKPKIKFGSVDDTGGGGQVEEGRRRTRGKKINFVDALGSDSDEDNNKVKRPPPRIESEEEYVANEEELDEDEKVTDEESDNKQTKQVSKVPTLPPSQTPVVRGPEEETEDEPNPIDVINKNLEEMDENEMEKMMEEEDYANKQLQLVALQLEKEKKRKEREAEKLKQQQQSQVIVPPSGLPQLQPQAQPPAHQPKKRGRKPKNPPPPIEQLPTPESLMVHQENNDELSEPPGVSLPLFEELNQPEETKRRGRGRSKKDDGDFLGGDNNIEIAAPPQPFSQSQPTPSVITRMLQSKPQVGGGYPVGVIRTKQFAAMPEDEANLPPPGGHHAPPPHSQYHPALRSQMGSAFRQAPSVLNHFVRAPPPTSSSPQIRTVLPPTSHIYHPHRTLDPSPSGGGQINISGHNSPSRVASPNAPPGTPSPSSKNGTPPPPPPYSRPSPVGRFTNAPPLSNRMHLIPPNLHGRPTMSPYNPTAANYYGAYPPMAASASDEAYQTLPPHYGEQFEGGASENSNNSKTYEEESAGGEFGGLVSYFSSQREDDLES